jgi:predicted GIY-YIG superfamily endonuclease
MVHWVYVLECEDDYLYVGETINLFKRFNQHLRGAGSSNTSKHCPEKLIGLYNIANNESFRRYRNAVRSNEYNPFLLDAWGQETGDYLGFENHITERFLYERKENDSYGSGHEWYKVRGGKYTRSTMDDIVLQYKWASEREGRIMYARNPVADIPIEKIVDRPLCKCDCPSEVKLSKDKKTIYFVCALKNLFIDSFIGLYIPKPCDFWSVYNEDTAVKAQHREILEHSRESWVTQLPTTRSAFPDPCIQCHRKDYLPIYASGARTICQSCFENRYMELKEKYEATCVIRLPTTL